MFSYLWQKNEFQQTWKENDSNLRNILAKLNLAVFKASVQSKKKLIADQRTSQKE